MSLSKIRTHPSRACPSRQRSARTREQRRRSVWRRWEQKAAQCLQVGVHGKASSTPKQPPCPAPLALSGHRAVMGPDLLAKTPRNWLGWDRMGWGGVGWHSMAWGFPSTCHIPPLLPVLLGSAARGGAAEPGAHRGLIPAGALGCCTQSKHLWLTPQDLLPPHPLYSMTSPSAVWGRAGLG